MVPRKVQVSVKAIYHQTRANDTIICFLCNKIDTYDLLQPLAKNYQFLLFMFKWYAVPLVPSRSPITATSQVLRLLLASHLRTTCAVEPAAASEFCETVLSTEDGEQLGSNEESLKLHPCSSMGLTSHLHHHVKFSAAAVIRSPHNGTYHCPVRRPTFFGQSLILLLRILFLAVGRSPVYRTHTDTALSTQLQNIYLGVTIQYIVNSPFQFE